MFKSQILIKLKMKMLIETFTEKKQKFSLTSKSQKKFVDKTKNLKNAIVAKTK